MFEFTFTAFDLVVLLICLGGVAVGYSIDERLRGDGPQ